MFQGFGTYQFSFLSSQVTFKGLECSLLIKNRSLLGVLS